MDGGDQPTCSKYCRAEEAPQSPEPEPDSDISSVYEPAVEDSEWQLTMPSTFLRQVADAVPIIDLKSMRGVCRTWTHLLDASLCKALRHATNATHYQWEPIHYAHALYHPRIYPRSFHCGAHHSLTDKIYIFGGNSPQRHADSYDFEAHYNDIWTYDLRCKEWVRVFVPGTPYPMPKSASTLVVWKHFLVLFGGFRRPDRRQHSTEGYMPDDDDNRCPTTSASGEYIDVGLGRLPSEMHYFDVKKNVWEMATPVYKENGVPPFGLHSHSAVVFNKWMIVYGGFASTPWAAEVQFNHAIFYFDLEDKIWHRAPQNLDNVDDIPSEEELGRGTLVVVRPGRLFYHPSFPIKYPARQPQPQQPPPRYHFGHRNRLDQPLPMMAALQRPRDTLKCYFLDFNPNDLTEAWTWSSIPVQSPHLLRPVGPLAPPVAVRSPEGLKLVMGISDTRRTRLTSDYDRLQGLQGASSTIRSAVQKRIKEGGTPAAFYDSLAEDPFEIEIDCVALYRHVDTSQSPDALKVCVTILQGRSGHIGDYKVRVRVLDSAWAHVHTKGVINFIEHATVGHLPTRMGVVSPHAATTGKTLNVVRQSARRIIRLIQADIAELDARSPPSLVWKETGERPLHEEHPVPHAGLLMLQADGLLFITGGEDRAGEEGSIDCSIGGGTWIANPLI